MDQTKKQTQAIATADRILAKAGLPTYSDTEERLGMVGTAAIESVEMGKQLIKKIDVLEAELKRVRGI